jgi:tRNA nucleotidyltransferase/poly(A) polymerase
MIVNINDEIEGKRVVPYEIVAEEFLKSFNSDPAKALDLWEDVGALSEIIPELLKMKGLKNLNWLKKKWRKGKLVLVLEGGFMNIRA